MSKLQDWLNKHSTLAAGIAVLGLVVAGVLFTRYSGSCNEGLVVTQSYYSDDDGKTYFADDMNRVVPFDHNGKPAVLAYVYRTGSETKVHYLERFTPEGQKLAEQSLKMKHEIAFPDDVAASVREYKRPGETTWHRNPPGPILKPGGPPPEWITP